MNDDSSLVSTLGQSNVNRYLDDIWNSLVEANPKWPGTTESKFPATGFGGINSYAGTYISSTNTTTILQTLQLHRTSGGRPVYPFPQSGRDSYGLPKARPSTSTSETLWRGYIDYVKNLSGTYRRKYCYRTLMDYLQEVRELSSKSEDLWRTPHYPFHGVKQGATLFLDFLTDLDYGDEVGLVSYSGYAQKEMLLNDGDAYVDIRNNPITDDYEAIDTIQRHKGAGHYDAYTGMGYGIHDGHELLLGDPSDSSDFGYARMGARPTMIIMTDGLANRSPSGFTLPADWSWADWTDYDGDGAPNYSTNDRNKQHAFYEATEAIRRGVTVHTMTVGAGADRDLMEAIAFAGHGIWMDIPGGSTAEEMEAELLEAFREIAAKVPPSRLVYDE